MNILNIVFSSKTCVRIAAYSSLAFSVCPANNGREKQLDLNIMYALLKNDSEQALEKATNNIYAKANGFLMNVSISAASLIILAGGIFCLLPILSPRSKTVTRQQETDSDSRSSSPSSFKRGITLTLFGMGGLLYLGQRIYSNV